LDSRRKTLRALNHPKAARTERLDDLRVLALVRIANDLRFTGLAHNFPVDPAV
jgi:hypothetical protein